MRIGFGYDVHRFAEGRKLVLCGEQIDHPSGLEGHSDADAALHALIDALLGAACLGDIGTLFPDSDEQYRGIDSIILLRTVKNLIEQEGYDFVNADITIVCEYPKIKPYSIKMRSNIAEVMECSISDISVKATTEEKLGFTGEAQGIKCYAVCLLDK